ncbi:hypothetical protein NEOLEDRAFT_587509 [Neolentinus lepideus HHB14362 ss-1]|uniref:Uncharacterized protein n=1 Tax=Neolentinus lepideus HHB14362 ss-1 TaxID=1314782 RepID=A0A165V7J4_9AGAM|nr:hypothetical protein NEOLEDRAFT_587509 [Neolentinus lepideus HHB14362 ss-1]
MLVCPGVIASGLLRFSPMYDAHVRLVCAWLAGSPHFCTVLSKSSLGRRSCPARTPPALCLRVKSVPLLCLFVSVAPASVLYVLLGCNLHVYLHSHFISVYASSSSSHSYITLPHLILILGATPPIQLQLHFCWSESPLLRSWMMLH